MLPLYMFYECTKSCNRNCCKHTDYRSEKSLKIVLRLETKERGHTDFDIDLDQVRALNQIKTT